MEFRTGSIKVCATIHIAIVLQCALTYITFYDDFFPSFSSYQRNFPIFYFSTIHVRENFFLFCDDGFLKICFSPRSLLLLWWLSETQWVEIDGTWKLFFGALPGVKKSLSRFYCSFDGGRCVLMWLFLLWCRGSDAETYGDVALTGRHASYVRVLQW